ncbi:MAG: DUF429 domain-containing protein [Chitinivibrionales bacterium]
MIGIDGCPGGWFAVVIEGDDSPRAHLFESIEKLWGTHKNAERILIDMPIGLADAPNHQRTCDRQARRLLGDHRSSIFTPPMRDVIGEPDFHSANRLSRTLSGKGISIQSWNIGRKIAELDHFLRTNREAIPCFRESHPELCFMALNHMHPLSYSKKLQPGMTERLELIRRVIPSIDILYAAVLKSCTRTVVRRDDIIDAAGLAARAVWRFPMRSLPERVECDREGLPMSIWV